MAPMSRGPGSKTSKPLLNRKRKRTTEPKNKHRFQSFSERISKINVDPVRRATDLDARIARESEDSNFAASLNAWKELNLSENFSNFVKEAEPLGQSLAQVVHHQHAIFQLLLKYLQRQDVFSLEPILSLVAHFAHDLGPRFEVFFQQTVQVVGNLCSCHADIEAIEWSFHCLAWLFKYLSRLLVPDLRPLFQLLSPLLGKEPQKPFVMRFCAEAMSFLLRKAGAGSRKNDKPLKDFMRKVLLTYQQCEEKQRSQFTNGLVVLFTEAIKGVSGDIHSSGTTLLRELLYMTLNLSLERPSETETHRQLPDRVLVQLIHYCDAKSFEPILDVVLSFVDVCIENTTNVSISIAASLLFTIQGARKGSRITDWHALFARIALLCETVKSGDHNFDQVPSAMVLDIVALGAQLAPLEVASSHHDRIAQKIGSDRFSAVYLDFCNFFAELSSERFELLQLTHLKEFVIARWDQCEDALCDNLPRYLGQFPDLCRDKRVAQIIQTRTLENLNNLWEISQHPQTFEEGAMLSRCASLVDIMRLFPADVPVMSEIYSTLEKLIRSAAERDMPNPIVTFCLGKALLFWTNQDIDAIDVILSRKLVERSSGRGKSHHFLEAILKLAENASFTNSLPDSHLDILTSVLMNNVTSSSHQLRDISLRMLREISKEQKEPDTAVMNLAIKIENTPPTVQNSRAIALDIRNMGLNYKGVSKYGLAERAIPLYCFGLLNTRLVPLWNEACDALHLMCNTGPAEDIAIDHAVSLLHEGTETTKVLDTEVPRSDRISPDTGCTNLDSIKQSATHTIVSSNFVRRMTQEESHVESYYQSQTSESSRAQALRVLNKIPEVAEKKSRHIVHFLLECAASDENESTNVERDAEDFSSSSTETLNSNTLRSWNRKDKKSLLSVFAQFVNPKVLYRSEDVYNALLQFLRNGDSGIASLALKSIMQWKSGSTKPYEENLMNLLDDSRYRDELSSFLAFENHKEAIGDEHKPILMPIILSLLYGRLVTRTGDGGGSNHQVRRRAILSTVSRFSDDAKMTFLNIAFGSLKSVSEVKLLPMSNSLDAGIMGPRKQLGLLKLVRDMVESTALMSEAIAIRMINVAVFCIFRASKTTKNDPKFVEGAVTQSDNSLLKSIRHEGLLCLASISAKSPEIKWTDRMRGLIDEVMCPEPDKFPVENSQGISASLKLVSSWCAIPHIARELASNHSKLLFAIADCLAVASAQDKVKLFVIRHIFRDLVEFAKTSSSDENETSDPPDNAEAVLRSTFEKSLANHLLTAFAESLRSNPSKDYLEAGVRIMVDLMPFIKQADEAEALMKTSLKLLREPARRVHTSLKGDILRLLEVILPLSNLTTHNETYATACNTLSGLFNILSDRHNRLQLSNVFGQLSTIDDELREAAELCAALNSYSTRVLDEPDFDKRLEAFQRLNGHEYLSLYPKQWQPILHNLLFYVKDEEELAIRSSASQGIRLFIRAAISATEDKEGFEKLFSKALLPSIQRGFKMPSEMVRAEYVSLLGEAVSKGHPEVVDMDRLLGADEESSFFHNILHVQQHRRTRALRRLSGESGHISSINMSRFCLPLVENFLAVTENENPTVTVEAVKSLEAMSESLDWSRFEALLQRKVSAISKLESKLPVRALAAMVNSLLKAHKVRCQATTTAPSTLQTENSEETSNSKLASTLPPSEDLGKRFSSTTLPKLMEHVHFRDESDLDLRIMVATLTSKLLMTLPKEQVALYLPRLLIDVCNVLKSRAQEARELARAALAEITGIIGPYYFGFVLKQLRSSLQRGYQLHVLGYSLHSILVSTSPGLAVGDFDYCLSDLMAVLIDDIFGKAGEEKESQDYISQMKEVRQRSRSFDSMELLSSICSIPRVPDLIRAIQEQMEKRSPKWEKIDELLARLREGLRRNQSINDQQFLVLCYEILKDTFGNEDGGLSPRSSHKTASFAFDSLRRILDKHENLKSAENLSGFIPLLERSISSGQEEASIAAIRFLTSIIKVPLNSIDENSETYIRQAKDIIEAEPSTNAPLSQAALRLISAILRERPYASMDQAKFEVDIAYLLTRIKPDLQEPSRAGERDRQLAAFNFLRAVLSRGVLLPEIYDVMDTVRQVMITSAEPPVPDLARSVYSRFLLDYFPATSDGNSKGLAKQLDFLAANLQYPTERGRRSVMEVLSFVLARMDSGAAQPVLAEFFVPLLLVLVADDALVCRETAGALLRQVFERADKSHGKTLRAQLRGWLEPHADRMWMRVSFECWRIFFNVHSDAEKEAAVVHAAACSMVTAEEASEEAGELLVAAMEVVKSLCSLFPRLCFASSTEEFWAAVVAFGSSDQSIVKRASAELGGLYCSHLARTAAGEGGVYSLPVRHSEGLHFEEADLQNIINHGMKALREHDDDQTAQLIVQNLSLVGEVAAAAHARAALELLFNQTCAVARVEATESTLKSKLMGLRLLDTLCKTVSEEELGPFLYNILLPLRNITDTSISTATFADPALDATKEDIVQLAQELLESIQAKVGTAEFVAQMQAVQKDVIERREERRVKRRIEAVSAPEKAGKEKQKKNEANKARRKAKNAIAAGRRRGW